MSARRVSPSLLTLLPAIAAMAACSPSLNWREVRLEGPGLLALFPCRPTTQSRPVELAGATRAMQLHACQAGGRTYAVMLSDVANPAEVGTVLMAMRDSSLAKALKGQSLPVAGWSAPAGATPQPAAGRWQLPVPEAGAAAPSLDFVSFARGTWIVQASVIGAVDPGAAPAVDPFFEGLRFDP